jgi:CCR4-NOT transcriptional regulation complex NOT5 subunit
MTHNKFLKDKSKKNWEAYRKQRNLVAKLKKNNQLEHISMNDVLADQNLLTFMYYIYHGSYEFTYLNQRIRRMSWFK